MWHMPPGQKGSFLDLLTALTSKVNDFPHSNQVIDTVHQIIYHPAKFRGSSPSNGRNITGNLIFLKSSYYISNAVKYVLFANTVLILIQYFLGQMSVLRDGLVQTLTNSSPNIAQTIASVSTSSWPNG